MALGAFMEAVERLGVTITVRIDGSRERTSGALKPWTAVLAGPQFGEGGAIRADLTDLAGCLDWVVEEVSGLGKLEFTHLTDRESPVELDLDDFEELLVELASTGVSFSVQRNHLAYGYAETPWRVIVSGKTFAESAVIDQGGTFRESVGLALRWLRSQLDDGEWLDLYL